MKIPQRKEIIPLPVLQFQRTKRKKEKGLTSLWNKIFKRPSLSASPATHSAPTTSTQDTYFIQSLNKKMERSEITRTEVDGEGQFTYGQKITLTKEEWQWWKQKSVEPPKLDLVFQRDPQNGMVKLLFKFDKLLADHSGATFPCEHGKITRVSEKNNISPHLLITLNSGDSFSYWGYYGTQDIRHIRHIRYRDANGRDHVYVEIKNDLSKDVLNELQNLLNEVEPIGENLTIEEFKAKYKSTHSTKTNEGPTKIRLADLEQVETAENAEKFRNKYSHLLMEKKLAGLFSDVRACFGVNSQEALNILIEKYGQYFEPNVNAAQITRYLPALAKITRSKISTPSSVTATLSSQQGVGKCGSKSHLAAAAVIEGGKEGLNRFLRTLKEIETSQDPEIKQLENVFDSINDYLNEEHGVKPGDLKYSLDEVIEEIKKSDKKSFKLGGNQHSMTIIATDDETGQRVYRLLDFDGSESGEANIIQANNLEEFKTQLKNYFSPYRLNLYGLEVGKFELKDINTSVLREIPILIQNRNEVYYTFSGKIIETEAANLKNLLSAAKSETGRIEEIINAVRDDKRKYYLELGPQLVEVTAVLYKENNLDSKTNILKLDDIQEIGKKFRVAVYNIKNKTTRYVESVNPVFKKVQEYISKGSKEFKNYVQGLRNKWDMPMPGLNTALGIFYFIELSNVKEDSACAICLYDDECGCGIDLWTWGCSSWGGTGALVTHVMRSHLSTNKELKRTEAYFAQLKKAYHEGYKSYSEWDALGFPEGAVIRRLDLSGKSDQIEFGTQKLYTGKKGGQEDDGKKENAIPIREAVGRKSTHTIKEEDLKRATIILPGTFQSYISWKKVRYFTTSAPSLFSELFAPPVPEGADGTFDDIEAYRPMPEGNEFRAYSTLDYPYPEGTAHYRVTDVSLTNEKTDVEVILPEEERTLLVPDLEGQGSMNYKITGNGKQCKMILNQGGSIELSSKKATTWFLDAREIKKKYFHPAFDQQVADELKPSDIQWTPGKITFGNVEVQLDESNFTNHSQLYVQTSYALMKIDLKALKAGRSSIFTVLSADAGIWHNVEDYLKKTPEKQSALEQKYIPIRHYDHNGDYFQGNAYYDVENKRMLFTSQVLQYHIDQARDQVSRGDHVPLMSAFSLQEGSLGGVVGEDVYFYRNSSEEKSRSQIWKVDAQSGKIKDWYHLPKLGVPDNMKMWQENGRILFSRADGNTFEISENQKIKLVKHQRDGEDVKKMSVQADNMKAEGGIYHLQRKATGFTLSQSEEIPLAEEVQIYGKDKQGKAYTYYVENKNGERKWIFPQLPVSALENAQHLVLCHREENKYFFFDPIGKTLYLQIGDGIPFSAAASVTQIGSPMSHVMSSNGTLFATTEEGLIYQVDENGELKVEFLSENKSSLIKTYQLKDIVQTIEDTLDNSQAEDALPLSILSLKTYSSLANAA